MIKTKKAISPLIATVLLIGFAIAIAILVWFWYGNIIKEQAEKTGASASGKLACASEVKYTIKSSCYNQNENQILIQIENKGTTIDDLRISVQGSLNTKIISTGTVISATETKQVNAPYNTVEIGTLQKVTIIPVVIRDNAPTACSDKKQELKNIKPC
ncbi:hypothetical protein HYX18_02700 [Candidatus Woesearchaeota archaeon]|nr:hypothetical protein [Candidatus Woesearchaeota archaeon]